MSPSASAVAQPQPTPAILLVEASSLTRMVVATYLRGCGYRVIEADGPAEAQRLLESGATAEAAFIHLGSETEAKGFGLAQWIRSKRPDVRVLLTSGVRRTAETAGELCEHGPHLAKPYDHRDLEAQIRRLLAR